MKKTIASKRELFCFFFSAVFLLPFSLVGLALAVSGEGGPAGVFMLCFSLGTLFLEAWWVNRTACRVWVENGTVKCKGFFFGFRKECPISAIRRVESEYEYQRIGGGRFLYLVSDEPQNPKRMYRLRRDGYIALRKNKKNIAFLQAFFSGNIE